MQASTLWKLPIYILDLWVEHAHWPSCQNKSLFSACCLINAAFLSFSFPGFSFDRDPQLYFDDTCVVPERLEGKTEKNNVEHKPKVSKNVRDIVCPLSGYFLGQTPALWLFTVHNEQQVHFTVTIWQECLTTLWPWWSAVLTDTFLFLHSFPFFLYLFFSPLSCCCLFHLQVKSNRNPLSIVTDLPTSAVAPCSSGSSWSHYWMTQPMATS